MPLSGNAGNCTRRGHATQDNKQSARRFYEEIINARNVDALGELLIPNGVDHTFGSRPGWE
jgi:hypothetical protein